LIFDLKNFREAAVLYKQRYPDKNYSSKKTFRNIILKILNLQKNRKFPGRKRPNQSHVRITNNNNSAIVLTLNICLQFFFIDGYL